MFLFCSCSSFFFLLFSPWSFTCSRFVLFVPGFVLIIFFFVLFFCSRFVLVLGFVLFIFFLVFFSCSRFVLLDVVSIFFSLYSKSSFSPSSSRSSVSVSLLSWLSLLFSSSSPIFFVVVVVVVVFVVVVLFRCCRGRRSFRRCRLAFTYGHTGSSFRGGFGLRAKMECLSWRLGKPMKRLLASSIPGTFGAKFVSSLRLCVPELRRDTLFPRLTLPSLLSFHSRCRQVNTLCRPVARLL